MSEDSALESRATELGWTPQDQFKGDPAKWVDAATYVERGEVVLPILRKNNQELHGRLTTANNEITSLKTEVDSTKAVIEDLKKFQIEQVAERVKEAKAKLYAELAAVRKDDNPAEEARITEEIDNLRTAEAEAKREAAEPPAEKREAVKNIPEPVVREWMTQNEWFGKDEDKTVYALAKADMLKSKGMHGQAMLDEVTKSVDKMFSGEIVRREPVDRTESGRHTGNSGGGSGGKDYASLPADARAACDKDGKRFIGKAGFPDEKAWQKHFVEQYNAGA